MRYTEFTKNSFRPLGAHPPKMTYSHISPLQSMPEEAWKIRTSCDSFTDSFDGIPMIRLVFYAPFFFLTFFAFDGDAAI